MHFHKHPLFCSFPSAKLLNNFTLLNQQSEATLSATRVGSFLLPSPASPCSHLRKKLNPLQQPAWEVSAPSWFLLSSPSASPTENIHGGHRTFPYSTAPGCQDVLAFRRGSGGGNSGVRVPQVSVAAKDNVMWNCGLIACQQAFHCDERWVRMAGSGQLSWL